MRLSASPPYTDNLQTFRLGTPRKAKLSRRSAASTAFIGSPKSVLQPKGVKLALKYPSKPLKIVRPKLKSQKQLKIDTESLLRREISQYKKLLDIKSPQSDPRVEELQHAVHKAERKTRELREKINKFETMFGKLYKSLEEEEGTDELKKLSLRIHNEFNKKSNRKGKSPTSISRKKEQRSKRSLYNKSASANLYNRNKRTSSATFVGSVNEQLSALKNRTAHLINYLKL